MNIKDIAQFRTYYRQAFSSKKKKNEFINEHFIGYYHKINTDDDIEGFSAFINGKKDNIGNFLDGFLNMAQDTQAIYEFLQNAVDAQSTNFYMFYDEEYLLIINNGKTFTYEGVASILNVGQSTKRNDEGSIGKFGIGFKLVHRLVGRKDGINELTTGNIGPIVFSWYKNTESFKELYSLESADEIITDEDEVQYKKLENSHQHQSITKYPWLFKILLTTFPCQPNDKNIRNINYKLINEAEELLFNEQELITLSNFLRKNIKDDVIVNDLNKSHGSLFFLKLGEGKSSLLKKGEIERGTQVSLKILEKLNEIHNSEEQSNKLEKVIINDYKLNPVELDFIKFQISPDEEDYKAISSIQQTGSMPLVIEGLFGYCKDYKDAEEIKESTNFYLFFPLRQESHGFSFILHCNLFSNKSERTQLHQDEQNCIIFSRFVKSIITNLNTYKASNNDSFFAIYIALLLSSKPDKKNNDWLIKPLYEPLMAYLKSNIPTTQGFLSESKYVKIKDTKLPILSPKDWGCENYYWFKWNDDNDELITNRARDGKGALSLKKWSIKELIINTTNIEAINNWLLGLDNDYKLFLSELNDAIINFKETEEDEKQKFKENLLKIKLPFENGFYSITEINNAENNLFLLDNDTIEIQEQLKKISFKLSLFNLSEYSNLDSFYREHVNFLADSDLLFEKINAKTSNEELNKELLAADKELIVKSFSKSLKTNLSSNISLFRNQQNGIKPSKQLIKKRNTTEWLNPFKIKDGYEGIEKDLVFISSENIYNSIIYNNWSTIILGLNTGKDIQAFYNGVNNYYKPDNQEHRNLSSRELSFIHGTNNKFNKVIDVFYRSELSKIKDYSAITGAIQKLINKSIPSKNILNYISEPQSAFHLPNDEKEKETLVSLTHENVGKLEPNERFAVYELLKLLKVEAEQIKLFYGNTENNNGEPRKLKSSKDLLKPDENRPLYMKGFEIHRDFNQYADELSFMSNTLVYDNIILTHWENIIERFIKTEPTNNEVVEFYEYIKSLFLNKDSKSLIAAGKTFIYTNQDFELREAVFYNKNTDLAQAEDVIKKLTGKDFPISEIMSFLSTNSTSPFAIPTENGIAKTDNLKTNILLSKSEVEQLLDFCLKNGKERIFDIGYFKYQPSSDDYYFHLDDKAKQYRFTGNYLNEYVTKYYRQVYHLLEKTFKSDYHQLGLLNDKDVTEKILEQLNIDEVDKSSLQKVKDFIDCIDRLKGKEYDEIKTRYIDKFLEILFDTKKIYTKDSFEYKFLKLYLSVKVPKSVWNKTEKDMIEEEIAKNKKRLVEDIRTKTKIDGTSLTELEALQHLTIQLNKQFRLNIHPTEVLINEKDDSNLITTIANQFEDIELNEKVFIKEVQKSGKTYRKFKKQEDKTVDTFQKFIFVLFEKKGTINIKDYNVTLSDEEILVEFYQILYKENINHNLPETFIKYFKLIEKNYVYNEYGLPSERLSEPLLKWARTNQEEQKTKIEYLQKLGIHTNSSDIFKFRRGISDNHKPSNYDELFARLKKHTILLKNTLVWFKEELNDTPINYNKKSILDMLSDIYSNIQLSEKSILPWVVEVDGNQQFKIELNQRDFETEITIFYGLQSQNKEKWQRILEIIKAKGDILINDALLPNIDFIETCQVLELCPTIDKNKLKEAKEWDLPSYILWKNHNEGNPTIVIYEGEIPYIDTFLEETVGDSTSDDNDLFGCLYDENNTIYISEKYQDFEESLKELLKEQYAKLDIFKNVQALRIYLENQNAQKKEFASFDLLANSEIVKKYIIEWLNDSAITFTENDIRLELMQGIYKYQVHNKDLPLLFIKMVNEEVVYYFDIWNGEAIYAYETSVKVDRQKGYNILYQHNRQMYDKTYNYLIFKEIESREENPKIVVDYVHLQTIRELWTSVKYQDWDYKDEIFIYLIDGGIPKQDLFYEQTFKDTYRSKESFYDKGNEFYFDKNEYADDDIIIGTLRGRVEHEKWNKLANRFDDGISVTGPRAKLIRDNDISEEELKDFLKNRSKHKNSSSSSGKRSSNKELKEIGNKGEAHLFKKLHDEQSENDIEVVRWYNKEHIARHGVKTKKDAFTHYDFLAKINGQECYIECKATTYKEPTFYLSWVEWKTYLDAKKAGIKYILFRVFDLDTGSPSYIRYDDLIESIEEGYLLPYLEENKDIGVNTVWLSVKEHMKK